MRIIKNINRVAGGLLLASALAVAASGCTTNGTTNGTTSGAAEPNTSQPLVVVTTNILGDVVSNVVGSEATVQVLMPAGADPHNYQLSTKEVASMMSADLIIENGLGLEEGISAALASARGDWVPFLTVGERVDPLAFEGDYHDADDHDADDHDDHDHDDHDHDADEHDDHDHADHDHGPVDPHFWHDPQRMLLAVDAIVEALETHTTIDKVQLQQNAANYRQELTQLDEQLQKAYASIPAEKRSFVTAHRVFQYLAARYELQIADTILPSTSTMAEASAADLARVAKSIKDHGMVAIFTDASQSQKVAETIAKEVGAGIAVVPLHSESLTPAGQDADTYIKMMTTNADNIVNSLG